MAKHRNPVEHISGIMETMAATATLEGLVPDLTVEPAPRRIACVWIPQGGEPGSAEETTATVWVRAVSLTELLRVIQFFNSGGLHCAADLGATEDGYTPGAGASTCAVHSSDYNPQDWKVGLSELLRLIQFFNSSAYAPCDDGEDGYCPQT
jgi:hypothetical protein